MRIQYLVILLICGIFTQEGWAPPPGQGGAAAAPDISKCDLNPSSQTKIKIKDKDGKENYICTGFSVCAGKVVPVSCKVGEKESCPISKKCVSFPSGVVSEDTVRITITQRTRIDFNLSSNASIPITFPNPFPPNPPFPVKSTVGEPLILAFKDGKQITPPSIYYNGPNVYSSNLDITGTLALKEYTFEFQFYEVTFNSMWWCGSIYIPIEGYPGGYVQWNKICIPPGQPPTPPFSKPRGIIKKYLIIKVVPEGDYLRK